MSETRARITSSSGASEGEEFIPVVEEELHVGKRKVNRGRIHIHSHAVERPVQEQVTLWNETVDVERRPVSGDMRTGGASRLSHLKY